MPRTTIAHLCKTWHTPYIQPDFQLNRRWKCRLRRTFEIHANLVLIDLLGAAALLLWGLRLIKTGMLRAFGASLRYWIGRSTSNRVSAAISGLVATLALQSSTATAIITASFAARELITGVMAQAVMLGANVGTALAASVLSLDVHWLSPLLILLGVTTFSRSGQARGKGIGRALLGLGLMLLSLTLISQATSPIRESEAMLFLFASLDDAPILALILAAGLAFAASSSLAVVLFIALLGQAGMIEPVSALALVAGANLGGAIPPYLAVLSDGIEARRIAATNLAIRALGATALTIAAPWCAPIFGTVWLDTGDMVLATHIGFSLVLLIVFLPLLGPISRLVEQLLPSSSAATFGPKYLDESALSSPAIAITAAARETLRLGDMVRDMLEGSLEAIKGNDPAASERLLKIEEDVDVLHAAIKTYLAQLGREGMDDDEIRRAGEVMAYAVNLEHIGDIIDSSLTDLAIKKARRRINFSGEGLSEIASFYARTLEIFQMAQSVFLSRDPELARSLIHCKADIRLLEASSSERHLERLRARRTETIETSGMHLDVLRDLKRINAHLISVAHPILEDLGVLGDTRLKPLI